jgi:type III pantothenate kinase
VIDAGTAITYDLINGPAVPGRKYFSGLEMRFKALHQFTGRLPLVEKREFKPDLWTNH